MNKLTINKKLNLLDTLLDDYIDWYGIENCIIYLFDRGFTAEEIEELQFDKNDIEKVITTEEWQEREKENEKLSKKIEKLFDENN